MKVFLAAISALVISAPIASAQSWYFGGSCTEKITGLQGIYEYGYCVAPAIDYLKTDQVGQGGEMYESYMEAGVFAAVEDDSDPLNSYKTAKIYFKLAMDEAVKIPVENLRAKAYDDAHRAYKAANAALYEQKNGRSGYGIWVKISGIRSSKD